ncbi:MAG: phosphotransferase, partial [Chloroflexota bacterium]
AMLETHDTAPRVLRIHQPSVSRRRLLAQQAVRRQLADQGLLVPTALAWNDKTVFRCGTHWAELEAHIPHARRPHSTEVYLWIFGAMGTLHTAMRQSSVHVPRPDVATYAPPGSLQRWLPATEQAVQHDLEAVEVATLLRSLVNQLRRQWVSTTKLPSQLIHGDVRLSNLCHATSETQSSETCPKETLYLDFGFMAMRPRVYDLAYALAFLLLAVQFNQFAEYDGLDDFDWAVVSRLVDAYETATGIRLTEDERQALVPYTASVPLYAAALDGFTEAPAEKLKSRVGFLGLSAWLLAKQNGKDN